VPRPALLLSLLLLGATPAPTLEQQVRAILATAQPGARHGLVVTDADGREVVAIDADGRYMPASNTKIFTTAAAFATLPIDTPDTAGGMTVRIEGRDVILAGHGDARASSAPDCTADCLSTLADAVAAKTRTVRDVVGDDTAFPDERWPAGMSWNNMPTRSGTAVSALTLDDNEWVLTVAPGRPIASDGYYRIDDRTRTSPGPAHLGHDRAPGSDTVRVEGSIAPDAAPETLRVGIEDPAHHAAWRLAAMLRERGVRITGRVLARHRPADAGDDPARRGAAPPARPPQPPVLARLQPAPLAADIATIMKASQNLHAELLLRRLGTIAGTGSVADGQAVVARVLANAGVPRAAWDFADGSGMSSYNRVTPRATVAVLRWIERQPWGTRWYATLPVGGVDGTLARRFRGTLLEGKIVAKTGSLNATAALAGRLTAASGRRLTFAAYANDGPGGASGSAALDAALLAVAAAN